jgi:hypothetical protein
MPLMNIGVEQQEQASAAGLYSYPQLGQIKKNTHVGDEFRRSTLNPTNSYALYTTAATGTGTAAISTTVLKLQASGAAGDDVSVVSTGLAFSRVSRSVQLDSRSLVIMRVIFQTPTTTNTEGFIGLVRTSSALTALPTTARHLGVYWDRSANANYILTSGNNSAQVTTNTGEAIANTPLMLEITWTGDDSATIRLYKETALNNEDFSTLISTHTVTSLANAAASAFEMYLHFFIQSESTATTDLDVHQWLASAT